MGGVFASPCTNRAVPLLLPHVSHVLLVKAVNLRQFLLFQAFIAVMAQTSSKEIHFLIKLRQTLTSCLHNKRKLIDNNLLLVV